MRKTTIAVALTLCLGTAAHAQSRWSNFGNGVLQDTNTGLQWMQTDNHGNIDQASAVRWCEELDVAGGGWRLPTTSELQGIISTSEGTTHCNGLECHLPPVFQLTGGFAWTMNGSQMGARRVNLVTGSSGQALPSEATYSRALCVRSQPVSAPATAAPVATAPQSAMRAAPAAPVGSRWLSGGAGVLKDQTTGMEWTQHDNSQNVDRLTAENWCSTLGLAGGGWRLPQAPELQSLMSTDSQNKCGNLIPCKVSAQFQITEYRFWSSTPATPVAGHPYGTIVSLVDGKASPWQYDFPNRVLCTRTAQR